MTEPTPVVLSSPDRGNRGAGEILRMARESQRITLEGLASMIKVTPAKLDALEQGQYDKLPDANFTRALAMTVCRALKLDPTDVLTALPAAKPAALAEGKPPLNQPFKEVRGGSPLFDQHWNWSSVLSFKWLAPLLLLVAAVLIYALPDAIVAPHWLQKALHGEPHADVAVGQPVASAPGASPEVLPPEMSASSPADAARATGAAPAAPPAVAGATPSAPQEAGVTPLVLDSAASPSVASTTADPRLTPPVAQPAPADSSPAVSGSGAVLINVTSSSWIEVRDANGAKLLSRHVAAGEALTLDGPAPLSLRIGNAPGVQVSYKGQAVDLGPVTRNNVARLELK